jgi:hypothetical protein
MPLTVQRQDIWHLSVQRFVQGGVVQGEDHDEPWGLHHDRGGGVRAGAVWDGQS